MSKRPSSKQNNCCSSNCSSKYGYAIIGDTGSGTLYAKRLISNDIVSEISLINQGIDRTSQDNIVKPDFAVDTTRTILQYLMTEQIHMVPNGNGNYKDCTAPCQCDLVTPYRVGSGTLGDFIGGYFIPRAGPWFSKSTSSHAEKFIKNNTTELSLNNQEKQIFNFIKSNWNLKSTSSSVVTRPSVMNTQRIFQFDSNDEEERQIFLSDYDRVNATANANYYTEASCLSMTAVTGINGTTLYDITANGVSLTQVKPVWKTNPFTYMRLAATSGYSEQSLRLPSFYRCVIPIPKNNSASGGVDVSNITPTADLLTTYNSFSLPDLKNPNSKTLAWLLQCYTATEDLSVINLPGVYADANYTLLIVEGLCIKNKRKCQYDIYEQEIRMNYNTATSEYAFLTSFAVIVSNIYQAYTGLTIDPKSLISDNSVCNPSGSCQDQSYIVDYGLRESPMAIVSSLISNLYGADIYPKT